MGIGYGILAEIFIDLAPGKDVLECGGATGRLPLYMAKQGWNFTTIDITCDGPILARKQLMRVGVQGLFASADVRSLPFTNASFDVVTSHGLFDLFPDIRSPILEMTRVLKTRRTFYGNRLPKAPVGTNPRRWDV